MAASSTGAIMLYCVDAPPPQLGPSVHTQAVTRDVWDGLMGSIAMVDGPKRSASIRSAFGSKTTSVDALDVFAADSQQDLDPADCSFDAALRRSTSADGLGPVEQIAVFVYPARSRKYPTEEDIAALQQRAEECESAYFKLLQTEYLPVAARGLLICAEWEFRDIAQVADSGDVEGGAVLQPRNSPLRQLSPTKNAVGSGSKAKARGAASANSTVEASEAGRRPTESSLPRDAENFVTGTTSRPIILAAGNRGAHQVPVCDLAHHLAELLDRVLTPDDELQRARTLAFVLALALLHSLRGGGLDAVTAHLPWREPLVLACQTILQSTDGVVSPALRGMAALDVALSLTSAGIAFDIATDRPNFVEATTSELIERRKVAKRAQKAVKDALVAGATASYVTKASLQLHSLEVDLGYMVASIVADDVGAEDKALVLDGCRESLETLLGIVGDARQKLALQATAACLRGSKMSENAATVIKSSAALDEAQEHDMRTDFTSRVSPAMPSASLPRMPASTSLSSSSRSPGPSMSTPPRPLPPLSPFDASPSESPLFSPASSFQAPDPLFSRPTPFVSSPPFAWHEHLGPYAGEVLQGAVRVGLKGIEGYVGFDTLSGSANRMPKPPSLA